METKNIEELISCMDEAISGTTEKYSNSLNESEKAIDSGEKRLAVNLDELYDLTKKIRFVPAEEIRQMEEDAKRQREEASEQLKAALIKPPKNIRIIEEIIAQSRKIRISSNPYTRIIHYSYYNNSTDEWESFDDSDYILSDEKYTKEQFCNIANNVVSALNDTFNKGRNGLDIVFEGKKTEKAVLVYAVNTDFIDYKIRVLDSNRTILSNTEILKKLKDIYAEVIDRFEECASNQEVANQLSEYVEISKSIETLTDDSTDIESEIGNARNSFLRGLTLVQIGLIKDGFNKVLGGFGDFLKLRGNPLNETNAAVLEEFSDNYEEMNNRHQMRLNLIADYISEVTNCVEYK